jgi:hypothetical protein
MLYTLEMMIEGNLEPDIIEIESQSNNMAIVKAALKSRKPLVAVEIISIREE